jgi:hypothetical protein
VSRFQSALRALLFFHPLLRYADHQLSLEREIACDDRVLDLGAEPKTYAEAILKAAERSFLTDVVHQAASFNSRRLLRSPAAPKLGPIRSLHYFAPIIEEVRSNPLSENYLEYLRRKLAATGATV